MSNEKQSLPQRQPYTILRIKRKRTEEPLDALVVESRMRRKKSRGGLDVFHFAETIEPHEWDDERATKELQDRISTLAREKSSNVEAEPAKVPEAPVPPKADPARQYTIINAREEAQPSRHPTAPPVVVSAKDLEKQQSDFQMYDAVLASEPAASVDPQMEKFLPLLQDYLKISDIPASPMEDQSSSTDAHPTPQSSDANTGDHDYVWDVFFHRPGALDYNSVSKLGTLTGLPASFADPYTSDSESEPEDEADEDSNAEEYYKNDYPDEESYDSDGSEGSDVFHEHSDYDDLHTEFDVNNQDFLD